ncbi:MAG TPA: hypothetical protein VND92_04770 [Vicinamibacterales bacterium]|nr:hypothetical protein [Vicinamibacterales bacterium]
MTIATVLRTTLAAAAIAVAPAAVLAQPAAASHPDALKNLKIRNLGPARAGGRVAAVAGIPGNPNVYYVGAAGGGIFKTIDGGATWKAIFTHEATSSIGALAVAPSNPQVVWVGTGEANIRNDITDGAGVYRSTDGGQSWQFMGLKDAGQISTIVINPHDADNVFVAVVGHAWAPNADRGVFRTTDGGKTWQKVLFVNDTTGASDLVMEPGNPMVLFAGMWQVRRYPWALDDGGPGSGLYRSTDGGTTWKKLTEGLPDGPYGRIAVAVAPSNPNHVYALIEAKTGLLWDSTDLGDHWHAVSDNHEFDVRPFYFSRFYVAPNDEKKLYFLSFLLVQSDDGGKTVARTDSEVHPDHHALWIDPTNPQRIIQGNDGGAYLSTDGGAHWTFLDKLPIEQTYMVAADSHVPYRICGGLQDNDAWCGPSNTLSGTGITGADWTDVIGGDGEYVVPAPSDPNIVYAEAQNGYVIRWDRRDNLTRDIRPYLPDVTQQTLADLKYRFNWTTPMAVSPTDANEVYMGANVLLRSTDGGEHWAAASGDLTRNDKSKQQLSGGPIHHDISGAESYDTILSISIAPTDPKVIWVGTDDGLVQVTRDSGKTWTNVTANMPGAPAWARVYQVGVSPFDAGTAYVSFDAHMLDDRKPYVFMTKDYGRTWTSIASSLPASNPVFVVREDPNQRGLLVAGTDTGLFYSSDDGGSWQKLTAGFPTVPVWDVQFEKANHDLMVATHGRGFFIFDDIRPLEGLSAAVEASKVHLFTPGPATLFYQWNTQPARPSNFTAPNPPYGAVIDYNLKDKLTTTPEEKKAGDETPVKIVITDAKGQAVATHYGPADAGVNRFVWDMRYDGPQKLSTEHGHGLPGPTVLAGEYHVTLTAAGQTERTTVTVKYDPRYQIAPTVYAAQLKAGIALRNEVDALDGMMNRITAMRHELGAFQSQVQARRQAGENISKAEPVAKQAEALDKKLGDLLDSVYDPGVQHDVIEDDIHDLTRLRAQLLGMYFTIPPGFGQAPNALHEAEMARLQKEVEGKLETFNQLLKTDVAAYNKAAFAAGAPTLFAGGAVAIK